MVKRVEWSAYFQELLERVLNGNYSFLLDSDLRNRMYKILLFNMNCRGMSSLGNLMAERIIDKIVKYCDENFQHLLSGVKGLSSKTESLIRESLGKIMNESKPFYKVPSLYKDFYKFVYKFIIGVNSLWIKLYEHKRNFIDEWISQTANVLRGYLAIYYFIDKFGYELCKVIRPREERVGSEVNEEMLIHEYFTYLVSIGADLKVDETLIALLRTFSRRAFNDNDILQIYDYCSKNRPNKAVEVFTRKVCSVEGLREHGKMLRGRLENIIRMTCCHKGKGVMFFKDALNKVLRECACLEYKLFKLLVDNGIPCIPRVEILSGSGGLIGEIDLLASTGDNELIVLEVTLSKSEGEIKSKSNELTKRIEVFNELGFNAKPIIVAPEESLEHVSGELEFVPLTELEEVLEVLG